MKVPILVGTAVLSISVPVNAQEIIGPWTLKAAPISATEIVGGGSAWRSLNVVNTPISISEAFSGFSIIDDGFANGAPGTTVEMEFAPGVVVNTFGPDLVMFDARFTTSSYVFTTDHDGFVAELDLDASMFTYTGEDRLYYYGNNPQLNGASVYAAPIDLSDLGVPLGGQVIRVRFRGINSGVDPLGVGATAPPLGTNYCIATSNSTGVPAAANAYGSSVVADNDLFLATLNVPTNQFGYYLLSAHQGFLALFGGSSGNLCLGAPIVRINTQPGHVLFSGPAGQMTLMLDLTSLPQGTVFLPGTTWNFQSWFRDITPLPPFTTSNTSDGLAITWQ